MRVNLPVSQREYDYPSDRMLVSMTDTKGIITHCNHAFVETSGFSYEELIGQNHNLVRHPDMPPAAYRDMWNTIGRGHPWTALVKNRRKDGDHYWVQANVTPILENGKPKGYMSVRIKPSRQDIQAAEALYAQMREEEKSGKTTIFLRGGQVRYQGLRGWAGAVGRMTLTARLGVALGIMVLLGMSPQLMGLQPDTLFWTELLCLLAGAAGVMTWFQMRFSSAIRAAEEFAYDLAGCNLRTSVAGDYPPPLGNMIAALRQIQINLRAVVGDVREEITNLGRSAAEIASGSMDLSARTEAQASSLEETAASMEELSSTVKQTADTAARVSEQSARSSQVATEGGEAVHHVIAAMERIDQSSSKMRDIITVIEGIAFQTNILALNAAVEAARAGEQGRGFAVVASEVRALAQRSATAAKEIRELIAQSSEQISEGSSQMKNAGRTIDAVVANVQEVGNLIQMITSATKEQAIGISQVNEAVTQLDTVTQQNAALVEESAASADGLNDSASSVARAVQVFQLP
ncbi:methyl-accepting chemotaxis protein [Rhodoferax mekongensis]|uniref:Methyl-accepting chemotaxis protein n=1 Tax=Rhodoferax mekongensis TaxID=3068341 RepID=A0ABZ0B4A3_9BURK|nr:MULTISPECIES: methyl-accepting chemotaxis protein [unclassified Rhodoferax]MDT7516227.1 methyl-accepting chemotaxis protein [Rhodoferax sp. TBRC 17199]WNO06470.1 methyl-accepting chemotaxis protein [Rhodoferax sp. TBRC 17307]